MVQYLENLLHEKTKDSQSSILFAQWSYDKKIIPSALQAVSNLFPHYSLHDESHSVTIINNIVRILGKENVDKLSAIDIWLILESAYWHDLGMVVSGEMLVKTIASGEFIQFVSEILSNQKHSLYEFALKFEIDGKQIKNKTLEFSLELNDSIRFLLAEFFRRNHAERSREIVSNPLGELPIMSPRGVIPQRIIRILGDICSSHTKDFGDVMALPAYEVGIDIENAHPRFIACLLRIGDLLDLDNNRFSEVMLRTLTKVPIDTLNHKAKHLSITSFRVDREKIEITASCEDYDTASITQHWFNYLNDEISSQMINWNDIVPSKELGYLPTIGNLKVNLRNYDLIDGRYKPKFSVDTDKALDLLQGAGIYDGAYQCIREILQNAVDSSLIRVWLENNTNSNFNTPLSEEFKRLANALPIRVSIEKGEINGKWRTWKIEIEDKGVGISKHDLKYLMSTGSSSKNYDRVNIINQMPIWMKPSGTFGIGFQSIFMITDQVVIKTKSFYDETMQTIELNSPNSKKDGDILIKGEKTSHLDKPGAKIMINHNVKAIPSRFSIKLNYSHASYVAENFDPFVHESLDVEMAQIIDEVLSFSNKSYFPVELYVDNQRLESEYMRSGFSYYDEETNLEISAFINIENRREDITAYYKGQSVDNNFRYLSFIGFEVNIHKDNARDVLTLNRNKIKDEYYNKFVSDVIDCSYKYIISNFDKFEEFTNGQIIASMYLHYHYNEKISKKYDISMFNQWEDLVIEVNGEMKRVGELLRSSDTVSIVHGTKDDPEKEFYSMDDNNLCINLVGNSYGGNYYTKFIVRYISNAFANISKSINDEGKFQLQFFRQEKNMAYTDLNGVKKILKSLNYFGSRTTIPCPSEYFALRLKKNAHKPYLRHYRIDFDILVNAYYPEMLSPFALEIRKINQEKYKYVKVVNDNLINWVYDNRFDNKTTREEITEAYDKFCSEIDINELNSSLKV